MDHCRSKTNRAKWLDRTQRSHITTPSRRSTLLYNRQLSADCIHTTLTLAECQLLVLTAPLFLSIDVDANAAWLAAIRAGYVTFIMTFDCSAAAATFSRSRSNHVEQHVLLLNVVRLSLTTLPAISPVLDQPSETRRVYSHAWLEADAQIAEVHFVLIGMG
jgi:hypothetical protein